MAEVTTLQEAFNTADALAAVNTRTAQTIQEPRIQAQSNEMPVSLSGSNSSAKIKDLQDRHIQEDFSNRKTLDQQEDVLGSRFKGRVLDNAS